MPDDQTLLAQWRVPLDRTAEVPPSPGRWVVDVKPAVRVRVDSAHTRPSTPVPTAGKFVVHPCYRDWLARCGVTSAEAAAKLTGEVVSGHPDRHVVRVELRSGSSSRVVFLKREHVAGLRWRARNLAAGFGWVSRCEREATTLAALESAGLPGPQWLAHGEDADGRAFLLVDELAGATELPALLRDRTFDTDGANTLAERIGSHLAELHATGFATPDLAAKHLFVGYDDESVALIDWPSAPRPGRVRDVDVVRWLGALNAGILPELATTRQRLRVLWAYRNACRRIGRPVAFRFGVMARAVHAAGVRRATRPAGRAQRQPGVTRQRLVWVDGEAVVAVPEVAAGWPTPAAGEPYYPATPTTTPPHGRRERVALPNGQPAVLVRFLTVDPVGRTVAAVRERPWRSPAAVAARVLFHLERHGIPAPRLLAFGQRMTSAVAAESFLCADMPTGCVSLAVFLARPDVTPAQRAAVLSECGRLLRRLHDAGLRPTNTTDSNDPLFTVRDDDTQAVAVGSPFAVRVARRISDADRKDDLRRFTRPFDRTTGGWVSGGYTGGDG
jgi:tRNA A-37 threonylcarbamoyl transferase component Bud32